MLAVPGECVGAVNRLVALWRQKFGLRQLRPTGEIGLLTPVHPAHFLQAHDVDIQLFDRMPEVMYLQPPPGADPLHPFVDVVGRHPDQLHGLTPTVTKRGSIRIASALDGEKQALAACW